VTGNQKIIVDTNVIVAASIIENIKDSEITVAHKFYGQSRQLFSIFDNRRDEKIGILTPTVKSEAFLVLSRAVKDSFMPKEFANIQMKRIFFDNAVAFVNSSDHRMRKLMSWLIFLNLDISFVQKCHNEVKNMSLHLKDVWKIRYEKRDKKIRESQIRAENIQTEKYWQEAQKSEVFYTHRNQVEVEAQQLWKFIKKWPNKNDEMILAETIAIKKNYENAGEKYQFYIASCDTGFFSPVIYQETRSNIVTNEIKERFNIICDKPSVIYWIVNPTPTES